MAGSINLSLSQQFDKLNGNLLSGGRLYFYAAGTDSPQNAFKDTNLTLVHPNPIILASDGRVPQLYFADGSIHVRLTDNSGVVQFDEDFVLVIGPSSGGGGGGGGGVDATAIFQTGDVQWKPVTGSRSGWVRGNGHTIGSATSGATERFNADCQALFEYLWNTYDNTICAVVGTRGGSALADWSANKQIATLDCREVLMGGVSDMGNSDRGGFGAVPIERGSRTGGTAGGSILGEITHTLSQPEMPFHGHDGDTLGESTGHTHVVPIAPSTDGKVGGLAAGSASGNIWFNTGGTATSSDVSNDHTHHFLTNPVGSSAAHNNTPRTMLGTFYMKL